MKTKTKAIEELLKDHKELYVVDVDLNEHISGDHETQWVLYNDLDNAKNYLALVEDFYISMDEENRIRLKSMAHGETDEGKSYLRFRYNDLLNHDISEEFVISKIK